MTRINFHQRIFQVTIQPTQQIRLGLLKIMMDLKRMIFKEGESLLEYPGSLEWLKCSR